MSRARRLWMLGLAMAALGLALAGVVRAGDAEPRPSCRTTLVPAYVGPAEIVALAEREQRPRLLVVNPASGPGARRDERYAAAVGRARDAGMRVLGYVPTGYGARAVADVAADIDRYARWYGVDGVFLDETAHTEASLPHYRALARLARGDSGRLVVINPGVVPARAYFDLADVVVTFEGPAGAYATALARTPDWVEALPARRIAHLVYAADRDDAVAAVNAGGRAGYLYATSGTLPNPWSTVPDYLDEEERLLEGCG